MDERDIPSRNKPQLPVPAAPEPPPAEFVPVECPYCGIYHDCAAWQLRCRTDHDLEQVRLRNL
jgi:hypothetical protein